MKRLIISLWFLIAVALSASAATAEGNLLLKGERNDSFHRLLWAEDTLYAQSDRALYTWHPGDDALTPWEDAVALPDPEGEGGEPLFRNSFDGAAFFIDDGRLRGARFITDDDGGLEGVRLCDMALEDGTVRAENIVELKAPRDLRDTYFYASDLCARDGALYLLGADDNGMLLCVADAADPADARVEEIGGWGNAKLLSTANGVMLAMEDYQVDRLAISRVERDGSLTPVCALPLMDAFSLASSEGTGMVYAMDRGRICPADLDGGELGAAVSALALTPNCVVASDDGRFYIAGVGSRLAVLDVTAPLAEDSVLTVRGALWSDDVQSAMLKFDVEHPTISVAADDRDVGPEALDEMLTRSADADVYMVSDGYDSPYDALRGRGFMLPLDGSAAISGLIGRMYPGAREKLCHDGASVAVPVMLYGSGLGVGQRALDQLGYGLSDVPEDWPGFLDFLQNEIIPRLDRLGPGAHFSYDGLTESGFRTELRNAVLYDWVHAAQADGVMPDYEDPRLMDVLERVDALDLSGCGLEENPNKAYSDGESMEGAFFGSGYSWDSDTEYLIHLQAEYGFSEYWGDSDGVPLQLGFGDDLPGTLAFRVTAAFVNPYGAHRDAAVELLEAIAQSLPANVLYALCPDLNEPLKREKADEVLAYYEEQIAAAQSQLDKAEAKDRQMWEDTLNGWRRDREEYLERGIWLIPPDRLAWYRSHDDRVLLSSPSWFESDATGEASALREQYEAGQITTREFLAAVNRKARMQAMEG